MKSGKYKLRVDGRDHLALVFNISGQIYIRLIDNNIYEVLKIPRYRSDYLQKYFFKEPTTRLYRVQHSEDPEKNRYLEYISSLEDFIKENYKYEILSDLEKVRYPFNPINNQTDIINYIDRRNISYTKGDRKNSSVYSISYFQRAGNIFCYHSMYRTYLDYVVLAYKACINNIFNLHEVPKFIVHLPDECEYREVLDDHVGNMDFREVYEYYNHNSGNTISVIQKPLNEFGI